MNLLLMYYLMKKQKHLMLEKNEMPGMGISLYFMEMFKKINWLSYVFVLEQVDSSLYFMVGERNAWYGISLYFMEMLKKINWLSYVSVLEQVDSS